MPETIRAVYENGVLRPLHPVSLSESEHVCLEVVFRVPPVEPEVRQQIQTLLEKASQQVNVSSEFGVRSSELRIS